MKPNDIVIGATYRNRQCSHATYMGVGYHSDYKDKVKRPEKRLVVVVDGESGDLGKYVLPPKKCSKTFWQDFYLVDNK